MILVRRLVTMTADAPAPSATRTIIAEVSRQLETVDDDHTRWSAGGQVVEADLRKSRDPGESVGSVAVDHAPQQALTDLEGDRSGRDRLLDHATGVVASHEGRADEHDLQRAGVEGMAQRPQTPEGDGLVSDARSVAFDLEELTYPWVRGTDLGQCTQWRHC